MGHIHTKPGQHDHTVSAYIFRTDFSEPKLLLHKHRLLGKYLQVGGHIELEETPWQAIAHEILEESGYELSQLKLLQPKQRLPKLSDALSHPMPAGLNTHSFDETRSHFHTDLFYVFVTDQRPKHKIGEGESAHIRWMTRDQVAALTDKQTYPNVREIVDYIFTSCLNSWEPVDPKEFDL